MSALLNLWPDWSRTYWLLAAPLAGLLLWAFYSTGQQSKNWLSVLPAAFHAVLLTQHQPRQRIFSYMALALAWLLVLLALLGPNWYSTQPAVTQKSQPTALVIAIQLTPDVLAKDLAPSRLQQIRKKIMALLQHRQDASTALVVYAGSAHTLVPLSNDQLTSTNLLQAIHPDLMPLPGQRADLAIKRAMDLLQQGGQGQGQILLISNEVSVSEQIAIEQHLKHSSVQLLVLGVGTLSGAPMAASAQGDLLTDASGAIAISKLNATSLQLLSKHTAGRYTSLSTDQTDLKQLGLLDSANNSQSAQLGSLEQTQSDQGYWFILPLLMLVLSFARRGSVLLLICLLPMLPLPASAFELQDLWLRPDQQGKKLLEQQKPAQAAEAFTDPAWRASALYLAQDYQRAAQAFALLDSAEAHYNRGNALALAGDLNEALAAYQQALQLAPEMLAAQYNYDIVAEQLKRKPSIQDTETHQAEPDRPDSTALAIEASGSSTHTATDQKNSANSVTQAKTDTLATPLPQSSKVDSNESTSTASTDTLTPTRENTDDLERWLEQIPDDPSELLKRKFWYEQQHQETRP